MFLEIFKFELIYRSKRAETYVYFTVLFLYSIIAVDFLYEGELDALKRNAPFVIARTMGITSALFMMITSMIMGVPILRDFDHGMESLMYVNPIKKRDYLAGRFFGSFTVLFLIFCAAPLGMMIGDLMPWHDIDTVLPFNVWHYIQPFLSIVLPTLFFGSALFFVSGTLSRKLIVVYTQGILFLIVYLLSIQLVRGTDNLFIAALIEPFTFQTVSIISQYWSITERNSLMIAFEGVLLYNRLIWTGIGILALCIGYYRFRFTVVKNSIRKKKLQETSLETIGDHTISIPTSKTYRGKKASLTSLLHHTIFYYKSILKEIPFWAIVICAMGIILISSINLGTAFGVDSYPTSYIIIGELIENTIIFFLLIILFYSGELIWKERDKKMQSIYDALPISDSIHIVSKLFGLLLTIATLFLVMIIAGVLFQTSKGYYTYELEVYFTGFFLGIFPYIVLVTIVCFFFQILINHKFIAHLATIIFIFGITIPLQLKGVNHGLYFFGGSDLGYYSDMNRYGHFLKPYIWFKIYWIAFAILMLIYATIISVRGTKVSFLQRIKQGKHRFTKPLQYASLLVVLIFISAGSYIFYNTNILNTYAFPATENTYRANYEKELKQFEYLPQPKMVNVNVNVELYPSKRRYVTEGYFTLRNPHQKSVSEIHIQKLPNEDVHYEYITFNKAVKIDTTYEEYGYMIFKFDTPLLPEETIQMDFKQAFTPKGFTESLLIFIFQP